MHATIQEIEHHVIPSLRDNKWPHVNLRTEKTRKNIQDILKMTRFLFITLIAMRRESLTDFQATATMLISGKKLIYIPKW